MDMENEGGRGKIFYHEHISFKRTKNGNDVHGDNHNNRKKNIHKFIFEYTHTNEKYSCIKNA